MSDDIKELTKTLIQTKVIEALQSAPDYIETLVKAALSQPVGDRSGAYNPGYGEAKVPFLEYAVRQQIQFSVQAEIQKAVAESRDRIAVVVREKLTAEDLVNSMIATMMRVTDQDWRLHISFEKEKD